MGPGRRGVEGACLRPLPRPVLQTIVHAPPAARHARRDHGGQRCDQENPRLAGEAAALSALAPALPQHPLRLRHAGRLQARRCTRPLPLHLPPHPLQLTSADRLKFYYELSIYGEASPYRALNASMNGVGGFSRRAERRAGQVLLACGCAAQCSALRQARAGSRRLPGPGAGQEELPRPGLPRHHVLQRGPQPPAL